jgi:hypothetical protein
MSGVAIIRSILANNGNLVSAVTSDKIIAGVAPINTSLPVLTVTQISGIEYQLIKQVGVQLVSDRVQVTVLANSYVQQKQLLELVRSAVSSTRGTINGFAVDSIVRQIDGPDLYSDDPVMYEQSIDYIVRFYR